MGPGAAPLRVSGVRVLTHAHVPLPDHMRATVFWFCADIDRGTKTRTLETRKGAAPGLVVEFENSYDFGTSPLAGMDRM